MLQIKCNLAARLCLRAACLSSWSGAMQHFLGRVLFAALFLLSALNKLHSARASLLLFELPSQ